MPFYYKPTDNKYMYMVPNCYGRFFICFLISVESILINFLPNNYVKVDLFLISTFLCPDSSNKENSESNNRGSSGDDNGGGGGGGDNKPPGGDWWKNFREFNPQGFAVGLALAAVGALLFFNSAGMESREINWQEFRTKYLERGEVSLENLFHGHKVLIPVA